MVSASPDSLATDLRRLFPDYAREPESRSAIVEPHLTVARDAGRFEVQWAGHREVCERSIDALAECEGALAELLLRTCADHFHVHAAGCVIDRKAIVVLGGAGAGKSSLAATWSQAGVPVLGDDVVLVDRRGRCAPFKRPIKVAAPLLPVLRVDPADTLFWTPGSEEAWLDPSAGPGWAGPAAPALFAAVRFVAGAPCRVRAVPRREILSALVGSLLSTGRRAADGFDVLAEAVGSSRTVHVEFGSAVDAAETLRALVA